MPYHSLKSQPPKSERTEAPSPKTKDQPKEEELHFMTVAEVAKLFRIDPMTVYRIADRGELPSYKNFLVKDKKLSIHACDWFAPIAKSYPELEAKYKRLELTENGSINEKTPAFAEVYSRWGG